MKVGSALNKIESINTIVKKITDNKITDYELSEIVSHLISYRNIIQSRLDETEVNVD